MKIVVKEEGKTLVVTLNGKVGEGTPRGLQSFSPSEALGPVVLDCKGITEINSIGMKHFARWVGELAEATTFSYRHCPLILVEYMSLLPRKLHARNIESFEMPYECESCGEQQSPYLEAAPLIAADSPTEAVEDLVCPQCQGTMHPQVEVEDYLAFLEAL